MPGKVTQKIVWVLRLLEDLDVIPSSYFKKLVGTEEIWEARIQFGSNAYRMFCFFLDNSVIVLTHGFVKKSQKTPVHEIEKAEAYRRDFLEKEEDMSDLKKYIAERKKKNKKFAEGFDEGYEQCKIGVILRQAREAAGLTQEELAARIKTKKQRFPE